MIKKWVTVQHILMNQLESMEYTEGLDDLRLVL